METQNDETITSLQNHLTHLTSLVERINTLRKIPGLLLAPSTLTGSQLEQSFEQIKDLKNVIEGKSTQDSLKIASESFSRSSDNVSLDERRLSRKRRRPPSPLPESPRPPPAAPKHIFPPSARSSPLTASELPSYIREHNASEKVPKLHIWTSTRPSTSDFGKHPRSRDIIVRISIPEVLYAYVRLGVKDTMNRSPVRTHKGDHVDEEPRKKRLIVESVTVFGPRERKSPHSQSDFSVFQKLSRHIAWMIQAEPDAELQGMVALFTSYGTLFVSQCTVCHRVLSEEGHFPPICRIWTPNRRSREDRESTISSEDSDGKWEPRHRTCFSA